MHRSKVNHIYTLFKKWFLLINNRGRSAYCGHFEHNGLLPNLNKLQCLSRLVIALWTQERQDHMN